MDFEDYGHRLDNNSPFWNQPFIQEEAIQGKRFVVFIVDPNGNQEIIGGFVLRDTKGIILQKVIVDPKFKGRGVGKIIMDFLNYELSNIKR